MAPHPPLKQSSITPFPLLFPSTQFSSPNNMLHSHLSLADHIGRRLNDSCGHAMNHVQNTTQNYANYMSLNTLEGTEYDSGASTPPLWRNSPSRSPPHRPNIDYRCLSPSSKAEAIARGQRELMEMVSKMPESCYELSLRDLVEHQPLAVESKQESFAERRGLINGEKGNKKKKQKNPKPQIKRSGSLDNGGFLLKMVLPISLGTNKKKNKKKNDCDANQNCKLSPKPTVLDASGKSVDKEWWKKRSGSNESESGGSTINSGSTRSIRSSSTSSSSSSCRSISNSSRSHKRGGCLAFILARKAKSSR
ncbi:uncharacterized protein LOC105784222 [Gossypium raimondii]|uniref:Uncharacterized protein n=2 Tax=Gossypium raimondii TaxID=29730 RepID=A0A0D2VC44_GOSRA|nr:uncharacterized protein LOC105784222 [Gossypium raimondii]KJB80656.1 hypothetical protein B456_013G109100 [Gossypium raimondii]